MIPNFLGRQKFRLIKKRRHSRAGGTIELVNTLSKFYSPLLGWKINPLSEIATSAGANAALFSAIQAFVNPGLSLSFPILETPFFRFAFLLDRGQVPRFRKTF